MTLPSLIRIFFAIDLPEESKEELKGFICALKKKAKSHAIRWTKPENLHITLQFLPAVASEHLPVLISHVRKEMATTSQHATLTLGKPQLFPNPYRPRVIVLDVTPQEPLAKLSGLIGQGILQANYPIETRAYRAHLTLGRIKQPQGLNLNFLAEFAAPQIKAIELNEVVLFRSEPQNDGSKYTPLEKMELGSALF